MLFVQHIANDLRDEARRDFTDGRKYGQWAIQQIRRHHQTQSSNQMVGYNGISAQQQQQQLSQYSQQQQQMMQYTMPGQGSGDYSSSSSYPPLDFYLDAITRLEDRLEKYADEIEQVLHPSSCLIDK
jgi:transcription initiation factor TFIID subunit TAF12